jgi:hypothetical protein
MPRNTQLVTIDLRSGITTNESLLAIGERLWKSQNSVWGYRYPRLIGTAQGPWMLRQPLGFPARAATAYTGIKSFRDIGFSANGSLSAQGIYLIGANTSDQYSVWPETGGTAVPFAGGVTRFTVPTSSSLGCSAKWEHPGYDPDSGAPTGDGILVFSHLFGSHIYYLLDGGTSIRSLTTDVSLCPAGAAALAVHLDRLWMLESGSVFYTDPFDITSIRSSSEIQILGSGRCLISGQFGDVDTSGVPHLVIASANSVQVLDGDPQLGGGVQASLRTLSTTVGVDSAHAACLTPWGVFLLGTDGNLWRIPPGCQTMEPVGDPIRDRLQLNNLTGAVDQDATATSSIIWFDPYLYIYPGGETAHFYIAEVTSSGLTFWGPHTGVNDDNGGRVAVIRSPLSSLTTHSLTGAHVPSVHSVTITPTAGAAKSLAFDTRSTATGTYPNGTQVNRGALMQTGALNVPGHTVKIQRVILEILRVPVKSVGVAVDWAVDVMDDAGAFFTLDRVPNTLPVAGTYEQEVTTTMHFSGAQLPAMRSASLYVLCTNDGSLSIQRMFVELHVTPAQF